MGKDETIFRIVKDRENPYAQTDKRLIRDYRLHFGTRGLLTLLLSMPDDWDVRFSTLIDASPAAKAALRTLIKDAERHGYMHRKRLNTGRRGEFKWRTYVYESPDLNPYFDPTKDPTIGVQPSTGFRPMAPSTENRPMAPSTENQPMAPSTENQPMAPSTENRPMAPSTENRYIYIYLYDMLLKMEDDGTENGKKHGKDDDDDVLISSLPSFVNVNDQEFARAKRDAARLLAGWCSAAILDYLPHWNGGERFADTLIDEQVETLAAWIWAYIEMSDVQSAMRFKRRNGDPFEGVENPVGKIIAQVRLNHWPAFTHEDGRDCAESVMHWSDPSAVLLDTGDDDEELAPF